MNKQEVVSSPINFVRMAASTESSALIDLAHNLMVDIQENSVVRVMRFAHDKLTAQSIIPKYSKPIIDEIDRVLARHYGFTDEELDYIINYDIKYRIGDTLGEEAE